jgi:hypothetical protein
MNVELIKKLNTSYEMSDGYITIHSYDAKSNILKISDKLENNNAKLYGKLFHLNMNLDDVLEKIKEIDQSNGKYTLDVVYVKKEFGSVYKAYIIY